MRQKRVVKAEQPRGVHRQGGEHTGMAFPISRTQARLMLAALFVSLAVAGGWWLYHSPYLTIHEVEVQGNTRLPASQIIDTAAIDGASGLAVDMEAAQARVAALPGVRSVDIEQHGWTGATITVEERNPWGAWEVNGVRVPVDIDGYVLDDHALPEDAPVIIEADPQGAVASGDRIDAGAIRVADRLLKESERALGLYVETLVYRNDAGLTAVLYGPTLGNRRLWVTFGDDHDYDYKVASLFVLLEQARAEGLKPAAVDLRFGSRLVFQ
jgi:hypothetical protein